ncbi:alpha/beta hydrolase [Streptomyces sp. NPDC047079]|uniref:alpha/beta fold hydrolase n=1 Tax=Streptomyces sp. NPDC047079 TaxID=3154607 RepID=UPI0033C589D5
MATAHVHGSPIHYTARGNGPGLLLVHATGTDSATNFGHMVDSFTAWRTVIAPDLAGSGQTPLGRSPLTVDLLADQVIAAAAAVTDDPVDVVGFSLGAVVAAAATAAHPDRVRRLILLCPWSRNDDPRQRLLMDLWQRLPHLDERAYREFTALSVFSAPYLAELGAENIKAGVDLITAETGALRQMELAATVDIRERLARIDVPVLVVGASYDYWIPVRHARETHRALADSRYVELDCGHMAVFERPLEVVRLIQDFIDG